MLPCPPVGHQAPCPAVLTPWWEGFPTVFQSLGRRSRQWLEPQKGPRISSHPRPTGNLLPPSVPCSCSGRTRSLPGGWLQGESGKSPVSGTPLWRARSWSCLPGGHTGRAGACRDRGSSLHVMGAVARIWACLGHCWFQEGGCSLADVAFELQMGIKLEGVGSSRGNPAGSGEPGQRQKRA